MLPGCAMFALMYGLSACVGGWKPHPVIHLADMCVYMADNM